MGGINLDHVSKEFLIKKETYSVLKDISLSITSGEIVGIVGKNGVGKSTLLKIICGVYEATSGSIQVDGIIRPLIELGDCFQDELTGIENIYLYGALLKIKKKEIDDYLEIIISNANLPQDYINKKLSIYSTGMRARLAFSVALIAKIDILILDENLSVGDRSFALKSFNKIRELKEQGKTILVVSHGLEQLQQICTRIIYLKDGSIAYDGDPQIVISEYLKDIVSENELKNIDDEKATSKEKIVLEEELSQLKESVFNQKKRISLNDKIKTLEQRSFSLLNELSAIYKEVIRTIDYNITVTKEPLLVDKYKSDVKSFILKLIDVEKKILQLPISKKEYFDIFRSIKINYYQLLHLIDQDKEKIVVLNDLRSFFQLHMDLLNEELRRELNGIRDQIHFLSAKDSNIIINDINSDIVSKFGNNMGEKFCLDIKKKLYDNAFAILNSFDKNQNEYLKLVDEKKKLLNSYRKFLLDVNDLRSNSKLYINSVDFIDLSGNKKFIFSDNEDIGIKINCKANSTYENLVIGIGLYNDLTQHLCGPNTLHSNIKINKVTNSLDAEFWIKKNQLIDGNFFVTISIHDEDSFKPFDLHDMAHCFQVKKEISNRLGPIALNSSWKLDFN